jgi:hypothetical protein
MLMDAPPTPETAAALWSAVAATFAALSSLLIMLIQRRSLLESVRPELVLTGWNRAERGEGNGALDIITFETIRNVGRGAALHIELASMHMLNGQPTVVLANKRIPILAPEESSDVKGEVLMWWQNVSSDKDGHKALDITIRISCWDSRGRKHRTEYSFLTVERKSGVGVMDEIAPGVGLLRRTTTTRTVWSLKLRRQLARLPGLRERLQDTHP